MAIVQVLLPQAEHRHSGPGTYRSDGGYLVHVREFSGRDVIETEDLPLSVDLSGVGLVKLSDDPFWPDLRPADAPGADRFD